jgi:hypothetical protein
MSQPSQTEGAGNAGCPMHPQPRVRNQVKHTSVVTTVTPDSNPAFPAQWFYGLYRALPGERILVVTVANGLKADQTRSSLISPPPAWHQQRVSEPHGFAVRSSADHLARQLTAHEVHLALRLPWRAWRPCVHRIPPRVRDDARSAPLWDGTVMDIEVIWVRPERKYFCKRGWTGKLLNTTDLPVGQKRR